MAGYIPPIVKSLAGNQSWENLPEPTEISKRMKEPCLFQTISFSPNASLIAFEILNKEFIDDNSKYNKQILGFNLEFLMYCPFEWIDNV